MVCNKNCPEDVVLANDLKPAGPMTIAENPVMLAVDPLLVLVTIGEALFVVLNPTLTETPTPLAVWASIAEPPVS